MAPMTLSPQAHDVHEEDIALGQDVTSIRRAFVQKLFFELAKFPGVATRNDHYLALAYVVRDRLLQRWVRSARTYLEGKHRTVIYLSAEYLLGPQLPNALLNLDMEAAVREAMDSLGLSLDELIEHEEEPGLGNGGLGRLAACFMDSLATLSIPAIGHGIRYEFGIFDQAIRDGWQIEMTDLWLRHGNPWEVRRWDIQHTVGLGGTTEHGVDERGTHRVRWIPGRVVKGVPYDTPVLGYGTANANFLRLWTAVADEEFDLEAFQVGEYWRAVGEKVRSENITKVLYPNDESAAGKQLRLEQEYFFVSCALQDCIRLLLQKATIEEFADKYAIQLNDTHPALAIPELMRLLMDVHGLAWEKAWTSPRRPSRTRTTPCSPRRWRSGRSPSSRSSCRGISRSSTRSIVASSTTCARDFPGTTPACSACRSSTIAARRRCAWPTLRPWPATRSTAWRRCTRACSARRCSRTSPTCTRSASST